MAYNNSFNPIYATNPYSQISMNNQQQQLQNLQNQQQQQLMQNNPVNVMSQIQNQLQNQPLFPPPAGNVYTINNTLEVANVPAGVGLSVALCLPEGLMYIKTMQNGSPLFWCYRVAAYEGEGKAPSHQEEILTASSVDTPIGFSDENLKDLENYKNKVDMLEKQISLMKKEIGGLKL